MNSISKVVSIVALAATIAPSVLYFAGKLEHQAAQWIALGGTIIWFVATPIWMRSDLNVDASEVEI